MIRIVVVDDHELVRSGLCRIINGVQEMEVIAHAGTGHEAVHLCRELEPDVLLLDYKLPDIDGLETTQQITALELKTRILILTMYTSEEYATRLLKAGASGFMVKDSPSSELLAAIRKVANKGIYVTPSVMEGMVSRIGEHHGETPEATLSDREMQVLLLLAKGALTREVAKSLSLSMSTVETYRSRILRKLNVRTNADLARFAIKRGLIDNE
ncbi:MAG: response regulator transcription factor [Deltaproteobacteria bacterium]|nr:response regulator transcription factor [Deltaproteobacteria bacterium]